MDKDRIKSSEASRYSIVKQILCKRIIVIVLIMTLILNNPWFSNIKVTEAATSFTVTVDYTTETIRLVQGTGSTKFYMSTDNQKTWEMIDPGFIDISMILSSKEVRVYFKGNKDVETTYIDLPAENSSFKPVYKIVNGAGQIEFPLGLAVQYRNGNNGSWNTAPSPMSTAMYEVKGATLYFRTAPLTQTRAGKIVTVKVPKRPAAPSAKLDVNKLSITGVKSGETQYRVGDIMNWSTFTSTTGANYIDISTLLGGSTTTNTAIPAGVIELRTGGSDKKVASSVKIIEVPAQATLATTQASLNGSTLIINDLDSTKAYEYTVVAKGTPLDYSKAKWTGVTSKRNVVISKVNVQDRVLVRLKSVTDKNTKQVSLPSTYIELPVTAISPK